MVFGNKAVFLQHSVNCRLELNGHNCVPFECVYGTISNGVCVPKPCDLASLETLYLGVGQYSPSNTDTTLLNTSQCNAALVDGEFPHGTFCPIMFRANTAQLLATDYPRYDCSSVSCDFGTWKVHTVNGPQPISDQQRIVCTEATCPYLEPIDVKNLGWSSCSDQSVVSSGTTCTHERDKHTCDALLCDRGYIHYNGAKYDSAQSVCTLNPTIAPTFAPSNAPTFAKAVTLLVNTVTDSNNVTKFNFSLPGFDVNSNSLEVTAGNTYNFDLPHKAKRDA